MSATGLDLFDKTLHTTNIWLDDIMEELGPDRQVAWRALGAVTRTLRDRVPLDLAIHLGAQLPLLVRGTYYDQWSPPDRLEKSRSREEFLQSVENGLSGLRPIDVEDATRCVFRVLTRHIDRGQSEKLRHSLPQDIRSLWPESALDEAPSQTGSSE